jgi:hypothetical protein
MEKVLNGISKDDLIKMVIALQKALNDREDKSDESNVQMATTGNPKSINQTTRTAEKIKERANRIKLTCYGEIEKHVEMAAELEATTPVGATPLLYPNVEVFIRLLQVEKGAPQLSLPYIEALHSTSVLSIKKERSNTPNDERVDNCHVTNYTPCAWFIKSYGQAYAFVFNNLDVHHMPNVIQLSKEPDYGED